MKRTIKGNLAVAAFTLVIFGSQPVFSQTGRINAGVELGIPIGNFSNYSTVGGGISAKYEQAIQTVRNLNWTAGLGFLAFGNKNNDFNGYTVHYTITPVQGGVKYYFTDRYKGWYGSAELGFSVLSAHVTYRSGNNNAFYGQGSSTYLSFAPGVGYQYGAWDFSGRLQLVSNASYLSLRAAYVFDLNK